MLVDGEMELEGVEAWKGAYATMLVEKVTDNPHGGVRALKVSREEAATSIVYPKSGSAGWVSSPREGYWYRIRGVAHGDGGTGTPYVMPVGQGGSMLRDAAWVGTTSEAWQLFDVTWMAHSNATLMVMAGIAGDSSPAYFDSLRVDLVDRSVVRDGSCWETDAWRWTAAGAVLAKVAQGSSWRTLRVTRDGAEELPRARNYTGASNDVLPALGSRRYRVIIKAAGDGVAASPRLYLGGALVWSGTTSTGLQTFEGGVFSGDSDREVVFAVDAPAAGGMGYLHELRVVPLDEEPNPGRIVDPRASSRVPVFTSGLMPDRFQLK